MLWKLLIDSNIGPILLVCVYMPCDTGGTECYQNFTDICCPGRLKVANSPP